MPKHRLILGILALGILAALVFFLTRRHEPSYNGRSLSYWVDCYGTPSGASPSSRQGPGARAINHIGTNAIPFLLEWIQYVPPPQKQRRLDA